MLADKAIKATSREANLVKINLVKANLVKMATKRITNLATKRITICLLLFIPICWANPDPGPKPKAK